MKNKFWTYQIGIKWVTVKLDIIPDLDLAKIKYTNHLERATLWSSKKEAKVWQEKIQEKYPLAELVELGLRPIKAK